MDGLEAFNLTAEEQQAMISGEAATETQTPEAQPETPETEAPELAAQEQTPEQKTAEQKVVPLAALHESRAEQKALKAQLEEVRSKLAIADQLKAEIEQIRAERLKQAQPQVPKFEEDPFAHLKAKQEELAKGQEEIAKANEARAQQEARQTQLNEIVQTVTAHEEQFKAMTPDYQDAVNYIREFRANELSLYDITDPKAVAQEIANNVLNLSITALKAGKNPAELIYKVAQQYGYKKAAPAVPSMDKAAQDALETIQKGQDLNKTLSGGGQAESKITAESLANLEGEEFNKKWKELFGA